MRIFSGIQPTGAIHIGNYLGALKQWIDLQKKNECVFCIVDLHATTAPYKPKKLQELILEKAIAYIAAGIDPENSIIFVQSEVKEHTELAWFLNTITPVGELTRMIQYKEKSKKFAKDLNAGILNYPILMAADILLYKTELVPVGEDQRQHVELARTVARKFNQKFGDTFKIPKTSLPETGAKIMSLQNPFKKMSKSDSEGSYISLFDEPEKIKEKISKAVTDTGKVIKYNPEKKPGISNLLIIYSLFANLPVKDVEKKFKNKGYSYLKKYLTELLIQKLEIFRRKRKELLQREVYVQEILKKGAGRAETIAQSTMQDVRKKMGLI
ncbi:tryptophan--tRNA ligase [Patescibacteria group bacterium]